MSSKGGFRSCMLSTRLGCWLVAEQCETWQTDIFRISMREWKDGKGGRSVR